MSNIAGLTILGDAGDIYDALALGCDTYLLIHDGARSFHYAYQILEHNPEATILIRRYGGVSSDPRDVAEQCVRIMEPYWALGVRHIIGWNEPDRPAEGGWSVQAVADFAHTFYAYLHSMLPTARIHFPAFTNESAYQAPAQGIWLPAARQFDDLDLHAYGRGAVARYLQWAESFLPSKSTWVTEYNFGLGNPRPDDYGREILDTIRHANTIDQCRAVVLFTWNWPGAEPGGEALCLRNDEPARIGLWSAAQVTRITWDDAVPEPTPTPESAPETPAPATSPLDEIFAIAGDIYNLADEEDGWDTPAIKRSALRIHELINELRRGGSGGVG